MNHKKIIANVQDSYLFDSVTGQKEPIIIIDIKSSVHSFEYEIYSNKGFHLSGNHNKNFNFSDISHNVNRLVVPIKKDQIESMFFIKLFNVKVMKTGPSKNQSEHIIDNSNDLIEIDDKIFLFYTFSQRSDFSKQNWSKIAHIGMSIDDDNGSTDII
jgi:hypothetical protein